MYDWDNREEFMKQFLEDFHTELGTVSDGVYPGAPLWTEMEGHERSVVRDTTPDLAETADRYADALMDAMQHHVTVAFHRSDIDDALNDNVSDRDGRTVYVHLTLADERYETPFKNYIDRYADDIAAAEGADDLDDRLRDTDERHWTRLLPYRRTDWAEDVWEAVHKCDPAIPDILQNTSEQREQVDIYTADLLDAVESERVSDTAGYGDTLERQGSDDFPPYAS